MKIVIVLFLFLSACSQTSTTSIGGAASSVDRLSLRREIELATTAFAHITKVSEERVPIDYIKNAQCLALIPGLYKAAFFAGAHAGYGIITCRILNNQWSQPAFISLTGGSLGLQIGAERSDWLLLFMDSTSKESLLTNQITLGVDVSVSAGPSGDSLKGKTNTDMSGILAYAVSQGAFAGLSLEGAILMPDDTSNQVYYSRGVSVDSLLTKPMDIEASSELRALNTVLEDVLKQAIPTQE